MGLRRALIKLGTNIPELRKHLVPLLRMSARDTRKIPLVNRDQVERALKKETRPVQFEVHYQGRDEPVLYKDINQINFDKTKKVVLVFPEGSGPWIYVDDGKWVSKDRKRVR
jgi:hypothetical protein